MNKMKKILPLALVICLGVLPFLVALGILFFAPAQYSKTFYGALDEKYQRLTSIEKPKIVVVGGSSVAFGLDSQMIADATGYEVVNFGLYADLGTKIMLDLSRRHINEGDIVIIAPEMDEQTLSLYFNGSSALKATDDQPSMLFQLSGDDWYDIWGALWGFIGEKWSYLVGDTPDPEGVYDAGNFNEYGDISPELFPRTENQMVLGYDTFKPLEVKKETYSQEFVDYLNDYIDTLQNQGATVYYSFCPMNQMAVSTDPTSELSADEQITALSEDLLAYLEEALHCPVLGTPEEAMMPPIYFYDSNFHLNDHGVPVHTARLIDNLLAAEQKPSQNVGDAVQQKTGYIWSDLFFSYRKEADGTATVIGTTILARRLTTFYIPGESQGVAVSNIAADAFAGCSSVETLIFASNSQLQTVEQNAFKEIKSLAYFYFYGAPPTAFPAPGDLGEPNAVIYVPDEDLQNRYRQTPAFGAYEYIEVDSITPESALLELCLYEAETVKNEGLVQTQDEYFIYTLMPSGTWEITALTERGKITPTLIVPATVPNEEEIEIPVTSVGNYAMKGATAARGLVIPSTSLVSQFGLYVFADSSVDGLYMYVDPTNITTTVSKPMVVGAPDSFKIYLDDATRLAAYTTDYGWSTFATDGYYQLTRLSETDMVAGNVEYTTETKHPLTQTALVLACSVAVLGVAVVLYLTLTKKENKEER